jgi:SAM-dependent methyltransferase
MDMLTRFADSFRLIGTILLDTCPVCGSNEIGELWRLPQSRLDTIARLHAPGSAIDGTYLDSLPTLAAPQSIYRFDICGRCESIFLNPKEDDQAAYVDDASKVHQFRREGPVGFDDAVATYLGAMPPGTSRVLDAACGAGQALYLLRERRPELDLIGLELSQPAVDFLNDELGITAYAVDLDQDDLTASVAPGSIDFIILQEAFEHVRAPLTVLRKLAELLRPGGRIHFTAQFWGDNPLQIRPGEPIYINQRGFDLVVEETGLELIALRKDIKIRATLARPV